MAKKKRPHGEGMVRRRADKRWEGRIVIGHKKDGTPMYRSVYAKTQKELLALLHHNIDVFRDIDLSEDSRITLREWFRVWLDDYMAGVIRPSTHAGYRKMADLYINPVLGDKPIYLITQLDVQKMYTKLKNNGRKREHPVYGYTLSDTMINRIHCMFHHAMSTAEKSRLIAFNPVSGAVAPRPDSKPKKILDRTQLDQFIKEIQKDPLWSDFFYTAVTTGLRRGEICSLMWSDFDAMNGTLTVRRTLYRGPNGEYTLGDTKTYAGQRTIYLPDSTARILRTRMGQAYGPWIFPTLLAPEKPINPETAYRKLKMFLKAADLPDIRFHDLRHTFATHALANGVDAKTLSGILGHENASFTLDTYTHVTSNMHNQAAEVVGDFLQGILGEELKPWVENEKMAQEQ